MRRSRIYDRPDARPGTGAEHQQVANDLNISLSSSEQVSPNFWTDPKTGIPDFFAVQTPEYRVAGKTGLDNTPVAGTQAGNNSECAGQHRHGATGAVQSVYNHSNIQAVYDVYASVEHRDLGSAATSGKSSGDARQARPRRPHRHPRSDR